MKKQRSAENSKRIVVGITGSFGTGKTTVSRLFKKSGVKIIDADKISHSLLRQDSLAYKRVVNSFGSKILGKHKKIDRVKLGKIVFDNPAFLTRLNNILHPLVIDRIKSDIIKSRKSRIIVIDAPLLVEAGLSNLLDFLIVVKTRQFDQIKRIQKKFKLTRSTILKRIKTQLPLRKKTMLADFIIDNNGTIKQTETQVKEILKLLTPNPIGWIGVR